MTGERDRYLDLVRATSIVAVVVGHWLVADFTWYGGQLHEGSTLGAVPEMWPLTWIFQVIPLFFLVAGSANFRSWRNGRARGDSYASFVDRRVHRVLVPTAVYLAVVLPLAVVADATGGWGVRAGGAMMLQPLWFLAIYLLVVALTPLTLRAHERWGWAVPVVMLAASVVSDVLRIGLGWEWAGYVNVLTVWLLVYQLGYLEAERRISTRTARSLLVGGLLATSLLVWLGPYPARMVGVPGDHIANMHPPTLAVVGLALAQVGLMVLLRPVLSPLLGRPRMWGAVVWLNLSIMSLYLWHQFASVLAARVLLALGWPHPDAGTLGWWAAHLSRVGLTAVVLVALLVVVGRFERVSPPAPTARGTRTATATVLAVAMLALGLLALAGTRITEPWQAPVVLAGLAAGPLAGVALVAAGGVVMREDRSGRVGRGLLAAAALLALTAVGYAAGVGPLQVTMRLAVLLGAVGVLCVVVAAALAGSSVRPALVNQPRT